MHKQGKQNHHTLPGCMSHISSLSNMSHISPFSTLSSPRSHTTHTSSSSSSFSSPTSASLLALDSLLHYFYLFHLQVHPSLLRLPPPPFFPKSRLHKILGIKYVPELIINQIRLQLARMRVPDVCLVIQQYECTNVSMRSSSVRNSEIRDGEHTLYESETN